MLGRNKPDPDEVARVRAQAIADARARYGIRRALVSMGEQESRHGGHRFEVFCEATSYGGYTNRSFIRTADKPGELQPQFNVTPPEPPGEQFTLPTAREWVNRNAPDRPDTVGDPILGVGLLDPPPTW